MRALALGLALVGVACSFPSVTYSDASSNADAGPSSDAGREGDTDAGVSDAGEDVTGVDGAVNCDEDNDGYRAMGSPCGGTDCNDNDDRVHPDYPPGAWVYDGVDSGNPNISPYPNGDWNCDGVVEQQYPLLACGLMTCSDTTFSSQTSCGVTAPLVKCTGIVACSAVDAGTASQGCL